MADKLMCNLDDDAQNKSFSRLQLMVKRLYTQLNEPTNQNSIRSPKLVSQKIKHYNKTLGTSVINSPCPLPPLIVIQRQRIREKDYFLISLMGG